jgi:outer membrane protein assembly factor BamB
LDLAREWGATVPPWYAGQNPLIEDHRVVLAPGGPEALLLAVAAADGKPVWRTPNPRGWKMTHSSIVPLDFHGRRLYLYCASGGVVAVDATNGVPVWSTDQWKISIATVPSPVVIPPDRILLAGGYNAGSLMVRLSDKDGVIAHTVEWRAKAEVFGSDQQTPVVYRDHIYGVKAGGQMACLTLAGAVRWTSGPAHVFGLGPYLIADGKIFALNDEGVLTLLEAQPDAFRPLTSAKVLSGHDAWGPLALVNGRLILRDFTRMICLDVAQR